MGCTRVCSLSGDATRPETPVAVLAVSAQGPTSPAFRVRTRIPARALAEQGVAVDHAPLFSAAAAAAFAAGGPAARARTLLRSRGQYEALLLQRQVDMLPSRSLERLAMEGRRVVLDVDDALWLDTSRDAGGHRLAFVKDSRRKLAWLAAAADRILAGNEFLADWLSGHSAAVEVVPSLVDPDLIAVRQHADGPTMVLGWLGSATTAPHLAARASELDEAARRSPVPLELHVVGGPVPPVRRLPVTAEPWSIEAERRLLARMDVGLMPLPDNAWTRGKCAYKALVYMAAGVPAVTDDVGVSARVIGHELGGLVARPGQWPDALLTLARDTPLRARLGETARARVVSEFSVQRWAPVIAAALRGGEAPGRPDIPR
jgi:hypothetical protein